MKKIITICLFVSFLVSCGSSKNIRQSKRIMKGTWVLQQINYNEKGTYEINFFNDISQPCLEGSQWQFVPNNNTGTYTINKSYCNNGDRFFVFTVQEIDVATGLYDFLLKPTNLKHKSNTNHGFRLRLTHLNDTNMQWKQTVNVNGSPFTIQLNFIKI